MYRGRHGPRRPDWLFEARQRAIAFACRGEWLRR